MVYLGKQPGGGGGVMGYMRFLTVQYCTVPYFTILYCRVWVPSRRRGGGLRRPHPVRYGGHHPLHHPQEVKAAVWAGKAMVS